MKNIIFLITLLFSINSISQSSTWTVLNSGTTNNLLSVATKNDIECFAVGANGTMIKTLDGGLTWNNVTSGTSNRLFAIQFTDSLNGFCVGYNATAIKTTDGGLTWSNMTITTNTSVDFSALNFVTPMIGFAGGSLGLSSIMFKTTNGGASWSQLTLSLSSRGIYGINFINSTTGFYSDGSGYVFKTTNSGSSWIGINLFTSYLNRFHVSASGNQFLVGRNGVIQKSSDMGTSWSSVTVSSPVTLHFSEIEFTNQNNGFIVGGSLTNTTGYILSTTNGGNQWAIYYPPLCNSLYSLDFSSEHIGYAVGGNGTIVKYVKKNTAFLNEKNKNFEMSLFPNPIENGFVNISINPNLDFNEITFEVFDMNGKVVKRFTKNQSTLIKLNIESLESGAYFVRAIIENNNLQTLKFIKN